jgi:prolyl oligopeptidase
LGQPQGQSLGEAQEVFRGAASDGGYGVSPVIWRDDQGDIAAQGGDPALLDL